MSWLIYSLTIWIIHYSLLYSSTKSDLIFTRSSLQNQIPFRGKVRSLQRTPRIKGSGSWCRGLCHIFSETTRFRGGWAQLLSSSKFQCWNFHELVNRRCFNCERSNLFSTFYLTRYQHTLTIIRARTYFPHKNISRLLKMHIFTIWKANWK